ncbi:Lipid_bd domain containing protein [Flavobacterium anhuiense]|uniref:Lipid_bd domain containing protein n=1 Tax=Flavobacterium anhuiense TaxID=459526 RepID=A0A444VWH9_9FLAO|nr:lipid-binding protein [Flavobacterium anhuiense]RYJ37916.1 Lipid_bd domain containing protein [Flavobacterium anhuiense]
MKKLKLNITRVLVAMLVLTSFVACDEVGDTDPGGTSVESMSGDWFITLTDSDGKVVVANALHETYNTAANDNTMWIDDAKHGYWIKCKVVVDVKTGTFSATSADNLLDGSKVTITNGKIEKGAATSKGGHKVDKISFRAHFDYDPAGYDILYEGHKRTGFYEDEY